MEFKQPKLHSKLLRQRLPMPWGINSLGSKLCKLRSKLPTRPNRQLPQIRNHSLLKATVRTTA